MARMIAGLYLVLVYGSGLLLLITRDDRWLVALGVALVGWAFCRTTLANR